MPPHTPASTLSLSALCTHGAAVSTYPSVNVVSVCTLHPRSCVLHIPQRQRCLCLHSAPAELRSPHTPASTLSLSALCTHGAAVSTYPSVNVVSVCTLHPRSCGLHITQRQNLELCLCLLITVSQPETPGSLR